MAGSKRPNDLSSLRKRVEEADLVLVGDDQNVADPARAAELYIAAIDDGSGLAATRAAMLAAVGVARPADWSEALDLLLQGAVLGDRSARRQLALIAGRTGDRFATGEASSAGLWRGVRESIDLEAVLTPPRIKQISASPMIGVMEGFAPPAYAQWLMEHAAGLLEPSQVYDAQTGQVRDHEMRTATTAAFTVRTGHRIAGRCMRACRRPRAANGSCRSGCVTRFSP